MGCFAVQAPCAILLHMTTHQSFSMGAMIKEGFSLFKKHAKFLVLAGLATFFIQLVLQLASMGRAGFFGDLVINLVVAFIGILITVGWTKVFLSIIRAGNTSWSTFKTEPSVWLRFIKTYLWYIAYFVAYTIIAAFVFIVVAVVGLIAGIPLLAFIGGTLSAITFVIVAIYFAVRYRFLKYMVLDYPELSSRNILRKSGAITKGSFWKILGFAIVLGLINLLGIICLVVGLLVTVPATHLAETKLYEFLKAKHSA